jgi:hypothetical protein
MGRHHSTNFLAVVLTFLTSLIVFTPTTISADGHNDTLNDSLLSEDAIILALRIQEGIWLDTTLALEIDRLLEAARSTSDTLRSIHARKRYFDPYKINIDCDAPWTSAWLEGNLMTGNEAMDSLIVEYHVISIEGTGPIFSLHFAQPLNTNLLSTLFGNIEGVDVFLVADLYGDDITIFNKHSFWYLVFTHVWGDWYMRILHEYYWYVFVDDDINAQLIDERLRNPEVPWMYLWNVPPYYTAIVFNTVKELLAEAQSAPEWWVRRHAVEVIRRLLFADTPWIEEDEYDLNTFQILRDGIRSRQTEVFSVLRALIGDYDSDVKESAQKALNRVLGFPEKSLAFYYPLHVGNSWTFSNLEGLKETIVDAQRISEELYFECDQFRYFPHVLLRMSDDNKLMMLTGGAEQVWLDFSADVGDTWNVATQIEDRWLVHLESKEDTVSVPGGTFTNCYRFWFDFGCCDNDWVEWYAPGVGPVKRTLFGFGVIEYPLQRAIVDGIAIPGLKGDVDGNSEVDVSDVILVVNIIISLFEPTFDQFRAADWNEDGVVDILDVVNLVRYIVGEEPNMSKGMTR